LKPCPQPGHEQGASSVSLKPGFFFLTVDIQHLYSWRGDEMMSNYMQQFSLEGKVALVTGAAIGIGAEVAVALGEAGATVVVSDRDQVMGDKQVAELEALGSQAFFVKLDVSSEEDWKAAIATIEQQFGRLDILVNNAGIVLFESVDEMSVETFRSLQAINVDGVFMGCKYAAPLMKKHASAEGRASIINLSSMSGLFGNAFMSAYCSSKGSVRLMSKSLAAEFGPDHIRVNSVHPGIIYTDMGKGVQDMIQKRMGFDSEEESIAMSIGQTPLRALGTAEDVASPILYLASNASNFLTATELVVDGGISGTR
jgi:NAD(P)-dependent dehydrogenase (short-subunit alcohol dehydrogenase family)